jgi:hypothetical protein
MDAYLHMHEEDMHNSLDSALTLEDGRLNHAAAHAECVAGFSVRV